MYSIVSWALAEASGKEVSSHQTGQNYCSPCTILFDDTNLCDFDRKGTLGSIHGWTGIVHYHESTLVLMTHVICFHITTSIRVC